ncbi:MAG TPA: thiamine-monophosphate kinase [Planctomycetaceae bacterium]|nr:thiamine-monophosphate kinase [Planctomycetaceae bacterium]
MEAELIAQLRRRIPAHPLLRLGPGDDAAVLRMADVDECVVTVDLLTDGVDFRLSDVDPRRVGHKSLAVNLSDLAAMAARPLAGVVALALPRRDGLRLALELYEGLLPLAERFSLAVAGGDTNSWDGPLVVSITLLGAVTERGPLRRGGARPGDHLLVTGSLGGSILGHHFDFMPRVDEALVLADRYELHAGIDISDGLSIDLAHLVEESGCGAVLDLDAVPVAEAARRLAEQQDDGRTALDHALSDGEDFELLLAAPPDVAERIIAEQPLEVPISHIGHFTAEPGLWQTDKAAGRRELVPRGWQHEFD